MDRIKHNKVMIIKIKMKMKMIIKSNIFMVKLLKIEKIIQGNQINQMISSKVKISMVRLKRMIIIKMITKNCKLKSNKL